MPLQMKDIGSGDEGTTSRYIGEKSGVTKARTQVHGMLPCSRFGQGLAFHPRKAEQGKAIHGARLLVDIC